MHFGELLDTEKHSFSHMRNKERCSRKKLVLLRFLVHFNSSQSNSTRKVKSAVFLRIYYI